MSNLQNDIKKWRAFKAGDQSAFEDIFRTYHPALLQYGARICDEPELLEDAIQDLFLEIWQSPSSTSVISVKAYLFKALKYKLFRVMKSRGRKRELDAGLDQPESTFSHDQVIAGREEQALQSEKLRRAMEQLPARQREIVYLRIYQELDYPEISEIMGINYQVARNLFYQSMKSLRVTFFAK